MNSGRSMNHESPSPSPARAKAQQRQLEREYAIADAAMAESCAASAAEIETHPPATMRSDWKMPSHICCGQPATPIALIDCGEAFLFFECETCMSQNVDIDWPFDESFGSTADFEKAGFRVE